MLPRVLTRRLDTRRGSSDQSSAPHAARVSGDETQLLSRLLAGDEAAFAALINRYYASMLRLARLFVADLDVAEEVVQDTWLAVINGLASFEGRAAIKTWIFRILVNRAKTRGMREARSINFSSLTTGSKENATPALDADRFSASGAWHDPPRGWGVDSPEDILQRKEALQLIEQEIATLPPSQQAVITLRDLEGLTSDEVRNVLGISETNQRVLLHRARSAVRRALEKHFTKG